MITPQKSQDLSLDLREGWNPDLQISASFLTCKKAAILYASISETGCKIAGYSE